MTEILGIRTYDQPNQSKKALTAYAKAIIKKYDPETVVLSITNRSDIIFASLCKKLKVDYIIISVKNDYTDLSKSQWDEKEELLDYCTQHKVVDEDQDLHKWIHNNCDEVIWCDKL